MEKQVSSCVRKLPVVLWLALWSEASRHETEHGCALTPQSSGLMASRQALSLLASLLTHSERRAHVCVHCTGHMCESTCVCVHCTGQQSSTGQTAPDLDTCLSLGPLCPKAGLCWLRSRRLLLCQTLLPISAPGREMQSIRHLSRVLSHSWQPHHAHDGHWWGCHTSLP